MCQCVLNHAKEYNISVNDIQQEMYPVKVCISKVSKIEYESKRSYFLDLPVDAVKRTLKFCTQNMRLQPWHNLKKRFKSPSPGANIIHCRKPDVTNMIYSNTPVYGKGKTKTHIFVGTESKLINVYRVKDTSAESFLQCLQDWVQFQGAPTKLIRDAEKICSSCPAIRYLRDTWIQHWQCDANYQHQN